MSESIEDRLVERVRDVLQDHPEVVNAYLFGSRARGDAREGSDADVDALRAWIAAHPELIDESL